MSAGGTSRVRSIGRAELAASGSLVETAYHTMRRRILDNVWPPGYRALEQELALELGMSRTPVREALIRMQNEGLVEVVPRHGMNVLPVSAEDMRDIYQMLTALESTAAELVALRRPCAAELKPLQDASRAMMRALRADDLEQWAAADESFHQQLVAMSGNRLLIDAVQNCWDRAHRARMVTLRMRPKPTPSTREHMEVVDRIREGDARGAFEAHRAHRERGGRELLAILERFRLKNL
ncbi:MAG: GntR family transcriptional regulator [Betaproteobacteria bacterium]